MVLPTDETCANDDVQLLDPLARVTTPDAMTTATEEAIWSEKIRLEQKSAELHRTRIALQRSFQRSVSPFLEMGDPPPRCRPSSPWYNPSKPDAALGIRTGPGGGHSAARAYQRSLRSSDGLLPTSTIRSSLSSPRLSNAQLRTPRGGALPRASPRHSGMHTPVLNSAQPAEAHPPWRSGPTGKLGRCL